MGLFSLFGPFIKIMGPLLRQHYDLYDQQGEQAAEAFYEKLSNKQKAQLMREQDDYFTDMEMQGKIAAFRSYIESKSYPLGFTKN